MSQATAHTITTGQIQADNGETYPDNVYHETSRATGTQQEVADMWADGALPTHSTGSVGYRFGRSSGTRSACVLYTSTRNFEGFQFTDGSGLLKHYSHIQAIRTRSGLVIGDSSCYGRGWAHCSYPTDTEHYIDLTNLKANLKSEDEEIYDITSIDGDLIGFESGREYDLNQQQWVEATPDPIDSDVLGM